MSHAPVSSSRPALPSALVLAIIAAIVYLPAIHGDFVYDDPAYLLNNPNIAPLSFATVRWAFTEAYAGNWHPLTWLSHALDVAFFGREAPAGHHVTSILIHAANVALLVLLLQRLTGRPWCAAAVGLLFAVHPVNVESVAWISERKNILCMLFILLTLHAHVSAVRRRSAGRHALVWLAHACALASKPLAVTSPFILLLLDSWPLRRLSIRAVVEKVPLLILSVVSCVITLHTQSAAGAATSFGLIPAATRLMNACVGYGRYLLHAFWPAGLSPFYPYPVLAADPYPAWAFPTCLALLLVVTVLAALQARRRPYLIVGWLIFVGSLVPMIGLVQVGRQSMADRFAYLPMVGVYLAVVWLLAEWITGRRPAGVAVDGPAATRPPGGASSPLPSLPDCGGNASTGAGISIGRRVVAGGLALAAGAACTVVTERQIEVWRDSVSMWRHVYRYAPKSPVANQNLGVSLISADARLHAREAEELLRKALALESYDAQRAVIRYQLSLLYRRLEGRRPEAIRELQKAVQEAPTDADYRRFLANGLFEVGRYAEAEESYLLALDLAVTDEQRADAHRDYAALLSRTDRGDDAVTHCRLAVELDGRPQSYVSLAIALRAAGQTEDALRTLREAAAKYPEDEGIARRIKTLEAG